MKIGVIGCGNMANAIISALVDTKQIKTDAIAVYDLSSDATSKAQATYGVNVSDSTAHLIEGSDVVILCVKPNVIGALLLENRETIMHKSPLLISIAAGKTIAFLQESLGDKSCRIVRVMPNINAKVQQAMNGYCCNEAVTNEEEALVQQIFSCTGLVMKIDEKQFPVFAVIAGCGPAFAYMFIDSMARAAVKNGMNKQVALQVAAQTVLGSASMILESDEHPWALIDQVCSPGGTTIEAVTTLQKDGFEAAVQHAVDKAVKKDSKL